MNIIFEWINVGFGLLAIGTGAIVMRGLLRRSLGGQSIARFLSFSLIASLGGLLPATHHLAPIQVISMISVYCSGLVMVAWLNFQLTAMWRLAFASLNTLVLYLNVVSVSIWLSKNAHLSIIPATRSFSVFQVMQISFAAIFAALGFLAARNVMLEPGHSAGAYKTQVHILN